MVTRFFTYVFALVLSSWVMAQEEDTTHVLDEVPVYGEFFQRFTTGTHFYQLENPSLATSLEDVLSSENSLYFKSYGNQQLASISFRGTSASQTSVLWHGIPANYPTLGQMDFSQWPSWFISSVGVQPGSAGALYGSGAIGGTVLLDSDIPVSAPSAGAAASLGSFGASFLGVKAIYQHAQVSGATRLFRSFIENDFPYETNGQKVRQQNAAVLNYGFQQQLKYHFSPGNFLSVDGQYTKNDRDVQPSKASPDLHDHLETENFRLALEHRLETTGGSFSTVLAYLQNDQLYNETDRTRSDQYSVLTTYWSELNTRMAYRLGGNLNGFTAASQNYPKDFADMQISLFGSLEYRPLTWWSAVLNIRQSFYDENQPFTPSLGSEWRLWSDQENAVSLTQQLSWGFRYPTLNDLHWSPGGNPDLKPEESFHVEGSLLWTQARNASGVDASITGFHTWSDNWIIWLPGETGIWSPDNFRSVQVTGFELSLAGHVALWSQHDELKVTGSYTRSINQTGATRGNQLPYVPEFLTTIQLESRFEKGFSAGLTGDFTGKRYSTLDNTDQQSVEAYFLTDFFLSKLFNAKHYEIELTGSMRNLFDTDYENLINRAMPGRNYEIKLLFNYQ